MSDLIAAGGSLSYLVLALGAAGALAALVLGGAAFGKRRVPLVLWVLFPMLVALVGAVGAYMNASAAYGTLDITKPDAIPEAAMAGLWNAQSIDTLSRWTAAFVCAIGAWCASLGAFAAGDDTQRTLGSGVLAAATTVVGAIIVAGYGASAGVGMDGTILAAVIVVSGFGVAFGSFKRALDEQAERVAGMRFASSVSMLLAVTYASRALENSAEMAAMGPDGVAASADDLMHAIGIWAETAAPIATIGWLALAVACGIAFFGFFNELGEVVSRYTLLDVFAATALLSVVGVARLSEAIESDGLLAIGTNRPGAELYGEFGADLQAALVTVDGNAKQVVPSPGGFGDVIVFKDDKLVRRYAWKDNGWEADETPLENASLSDLRPLIVVGSGDEASNVMAVLDKSKNGDALLMMRASEVKSDIEIPGELAHLQVAFLPLKKSAERDLEKELWHQAGDKDYMWGPIYWFGDTDAEEPLAYAAAVAESTSATGLNAAVGERTRVKDLANSCLTWMLDASGDHLKVNPDRFCQLNADTLEDLRNEAAEKWPMPEAEHTRMTVSKVEGDQVDEAVVIERLMREVAAIDNCVALAREEGEENTTGKMLLEVWFNKKGAVSAQQLHEKSKLTTPVVARCAGLRFKRVTVPWPEDWVEPEPDEKGNVPPMPHYEVTLDLTE